ncbi:probable sphingolipid transporter spinster homolog 2 isoform X2, partial [Tanacetum coccineum]
KTTWLGIFYMCIPTGVAVGYVYGGLVGDSLGWRFAFFGEAILMLPFAILGFTMKSETKKEYMSSLLEENMLILKFVGIAINSSEMLLQEAFEIGARTLQERIQVKNEMISPNEDDSIYTTQTRATNGLYYKGPYSTIFYKKLLGLPRASKGFQELPRPSSTFHRIPLSLLVKCRTIRNPG